MPPNALLKNRPHLRKALIESSLAGFVTFLLSIFMLGIKTHNAPGGIELTTRPIWVALAVLCVFFRALVSAPVHLDQNGRKAL